MYCLPGWGGEYPAAGPSPALMAGRGPDHALSPHICHPSQPQASLPLTLQAEYEVTPDEKRKACGRRLMQNFLSHTVSEP